MNPKRLFLISLTIILLLFLLPVWGEDQNNSGLQTSDHSQKTGEVSGILVSGTINIDSGYIYSGGNSGAILTDITGNIDENISSSYGNNLIISEVYYDGSDEWLEISNIGPNSFSGIINISGSINLSIHLDIQKQQSVLIVKPSGNYGHIPSNIVRFVSLSSFGLTDTKQINLNLMISGVQTDSFFVDTGPIIQYNDKKTSFQKNLSNGNYIIGATSGYQTTISGCVITPGTISLYEDIDTGGLTGQNQQNGLQNSGLTQIVTGITIQEVCLQFFSGFQGKIIFSGISQEKGFSLEITGYNPVIISGFCSDNGWLSTPGSGQSGRVLDNTLSNSTPSGSITIGTSTILPINTPNLTQNTTNYPGEVKIQNLNPFGDEYVVLESFAKFPVDLNSHDWFLLNKTTKRYLSGILYPSSIITVSKRFGFPDDGSCIDLYYKETKMDTRCYTKQIIPKTLETKPPTTGDQSLSGYITGIIDLPMIKIISVMPDVIGKDDKEMIILLIETGVNNQETGISLPAISLKNYYLLVNKRKISLSGVIYPGIPVTLTGSFALPNKASCIEIYGNKILQNKFCYDQPKEGQIFGSGNQILENTSLDYLSILQDVKLVTTGDQICSSYKDQLLVCRNMPSSKTSFRLKNENKLYVQYSNLIENYLIKNWSVLYFNTEIRNYFDVFKSAKKVVKKFGSTINISGNIVDIYNLSGQIALKTSTGYLISTSSNILSNIQNDAQNSGKNLSQMILLIQKLWGRTSIFWSS